MADYTPAWPPLITVSSGHPESLGVLGRIVAFGAASSQTIVANRVYYLPFRLYSPSVAVKMSYVVGGASAGNVDLGIYDWQKNRLVNSGSTAQGTASTIQTVDITDTPLSPGRYFMAFTGSASGTFLGPGSFADEQAIPMAGLYDETTGSFGLPATATPTAPSAGTPLIPAMCVHFDTLV